MSADAVMIMVAPTGSRVGKQDNPAAPLSPQEIADEVVRCANAGASIAHIHARDPDGRPTPSASVFREIVERIRERSDIVLQISLGTPGFTVDEALEPITLGAEMASLPLGVFDVDDQHAQGKIRQMAERIRDNKVVPELSVHNARMMAGAIDLINCGAVIAPACFGLILGAPASMKDGATDLIRLVGELPGASHWWFAKGGEYALGLRALAIELGGHVRVGFEDSPRDFGGRKLAPSNVYLVERIVTLCSSLGRQVANVSQARAAINCR